ncbi:MAG: MFS transporter [Geodermatophilaceae bacterium]|nr:MFS transporter [Geodermatophilaceae bacterium]
MPTVAHHVVRGLLRRGDFRRLLGTRLSGQFADGVFQASLAGAVLFNPERAATPADVAAGFAILLLPYSLVGPFAGVLLDRWDRRSVLLVANLIRSLQVVGVAGLLATGVGGGWLYLAALTVLAVNRFVLSALSAALPHVAQDDDLVTANALTTTLGAVLAVAGAGGALGLLEVVGENDVGYGVLAVSSTIGYLAAAALAGGFARTYLGPDTVEGHARSTARDVVIGLVAGIRHIATHPPAVGALAVLTIHRAVYGLTTLATLLLYRNYFESEGFFQTGIVGLGQVLVIGAAGALTAAAITPVMSRRIGKPRWILTLLVLAAITEVTLGPPYELELLLIAAFLIGGVGQAVKVCADTVFQEHVSDAYRGRVFSVSDTLFNLAFVGGLLVGARTLPDNGVSLPVLIGVAIVYLLTAFGYALAARRFSYPP